MSNNISERKSRTKLHNCVVGLGDAIYVHTLDHGRIPDTTEWIVTELEGQDLKIKRLGKQTSFWVPNTLFNASEYGTHFCLSREKCNYTFPALKLEAEEAIEEKLVLSDYDSYAVKVAEAYMARPSYEPNKASMWNALAKHIETMYQRMISKIDVVAVKGQPYDSAEELVASVKETNTLKVSTDFLEHPLFSKEQNFKFRAVHDWFSHVAGDHSFGMKGEVGAYNRHAKTAPPSVLPALFTEIVGQASVKIVSGNFPEQKITTLYGFDYINIGDIDEEEFKKNFE